MIDLLLCQASKQSILAELSLYTSYTSYTHPTLRKRIYRRFAGASAGQGEMKGADTHDMRQVVIPVRPTTSKPGNEPAKSLGHKDSILVGLGLILFLSFTWIYFVHRMYLNIEPPAPDGGASHPAAL
ncbi:hypothetical protein Vafri_12762 [Volvox africanus]|uniref:Uncharacterized protein n=1 Tax=Volvox africanus TaxID=51714 RepID=A0A8J4BAW6_9CHLO|nr:hypothetical protein Vafri_12762 [Volvox africanus]